MFHTRWPPRKLTLALVDVYSACPEKQKCQQTNRGQDYIGKKDVSISGKPCKYWYSNFIYLYAEPYVAFLDLEVVDNYCRNPTLDSIGPWCFVNDFGSRETCDLPVCREYFRPSNIEMVPGCRTIVLSRKYVYVYLFVTRTV